MTTLSRIRRIFLVPIVMAASLTLFQRASRAAKPNTSGKPALHSLSPLKPPPLTNTGTNLVLSRPNGRGTDPILQIIGDPPSEPTQGELIKPQPPATQPIAVFQVLKNGDVLFGQNAGLRRQPAPGAKAGAPLQSDPSHSSPIDFWYDARNRKLHVRSMEITENGDAPEIDIRRSGDGTYPNGPPLQSAKGQNLGMITWMGWAPNAGFNDFSAMMYCRAAEDISRHGAGASLHLATTPKGSVGSPVDRLVIGSDGNVGIGTTEPRAPMHIMRAQSGGLAEDYLSEQQLEPGDVVIIDSSSQALSIVKSTRPYDQRVVGTVAGNPAIRISQDQNQPDKKGRAPQASTYPIAEAGRTPIKVCIEGGPILPGDYLTSSSTPGVAMKATHKGPVVGKALQAYSGPEIGTIQMLAGVSWINP